MRRFSVIGIALVALLLAALACSPGATSNTDATAQAISTQIAASSGGTGGDSGEGDTGGEPVTEAPPEATEAITEEPIEASDDGGSVPTEDPAVAAVIAEAQQRLSQYGVDPSTGEVQWVHPEVEINLTEPNSSDYENIYLLNVVYDFVISSKITWNTGTGLAGCGFVLRSDGDDVAPSQYLMLATRGGNGTLVFSRYLPGNDTFTLAIEADIVDRSFQSQNGTTNEIAVVAHGPIFDLYTNGTYIDSVNVASMPGNILLERGFVAMAAAQESFTTDCVFNDTWLWEPDDDTLEVNR